MYYRAESDKVFANTIVILTFYGDHYLIEKSRKNFGEQFSKARINFLKTMDAPRLS